jgi:hypothetical protein
MEGSRAVVELFHGNCSALQQIEKRLILCRDRVFALRIKLWDLVGKRPPITTAEFQQLPWSQW